jgi:hypothetical protein
MVRGAFRFQRNLKSGLSGLEINKKASIKEIIAVKPLLDLKPKATHSSNAVLLKRSAHL